MYPRRIEFDFIAARPGKCPPLPTPEFCIADADECLFDADCYPGRKCCSDTCVKRCVDPVIEDRQGGPAIGKSKWYSFVVFVFVPDLTVLNRGSLYREFIPNMFFRLSLLLLGSLLYKDSPYSLSIRVI